MDAIVLSLTPHGDTSSLLYVYTKTYGRMMFVVYGKKGTSNGKKSKANLNILYPMSVVQITADINPVKQYNYVKSVSLSYIPRSLLSDTKKMCISLFIAEAFSKVVKHQMEDEELYKFLLGSIKELDSADSVENIPELFIERLSVVLGYGGEIIDELKDLSSYELINMF